MLRPSSFVYSSFITTITISAAVADAQTTAPRLSVPGAPVGTTAFVDVAVVPMDAERVLPNQTVLIKGGRITALGLASKIQVPAGAVRIDGRGQYLMPGLADMHVHMHFRDGAKAEQELLAWLAQGITTVRNMDFRAEPPQTRQALLRLRDRAAAGELWSPRIYTAGDWTMGRVQASYFMTQMATADPRESDALWKDIKPESVAAHIAEYKAMGYDFIKSHDETAEIFDSVLAAARRVGIPVSGHVPLQATLEQALTGKMQSIEHLTGSFGGRGIGVAGRDTSIANLQALAEMMRSVSVWNTPTLDIMDASYPPKRPTGMVRGRFVKALQDAGAGLLLGTDNRSLIRELEAMTSWGLSPYQALVAGTRNVAAVLGTLEETGTVAIGKRADLVLLTGNPLQDIHYTAQPAGVMIGGRWLPRDEIYKRLGREERRVQFQYWLDWGFASRANEAFLEGIMVADTQKAALGKLQAAHRAYRRALTDTLGPLRVTMDGAVRRQRTLELYLRELRDIYAVLTPEQQAVFDRRVRAWRQHYTVQGHPKPR